MEIMSNEELYNELLTEMAVDEFDDLEYMDEAFEAIGKAKDKIKSLAKKIATMVKACVASAFGSNALKRAAVAGAITACVNLLAILLTGKTITGTLAVGVAAAAIQTAIKLFPDKPVTKEQVSRLNISMKTVMEEIKAKISAAKDAVEKKAGGLLSKIWSKVCAKVKSGIKVVKAKATEVKDKVKSKIKSKNESLDLAFDKLGEDLLASIV